MNRRSFLKIMGALAAGIALRPLPVLGEQYSVLEPPFQVPVAGDGCHNQPGTWAYYGDGHGHDATAFLQSLLDRDREVIAPPGRYILGSTVEMGRGRSLVGSGSAATRLVRAGEGPMVNFGSSENCSIQNFTLEHGKDAPDGLLVASSRVSYGLKGA